MTPNHSLPASDAPLPWCACCGGYQALGTAASAAGDDGGGKVTAQAPSSEAASKAVHPRRVK